MNFLMYSNNRYQECVVKSAREKNFRIWLDAEQNALLFLLSVFRFLTAGLFIPVVLLNFMMVNLGLKRTPAPEIDLMKLQMDQHKLERNNKAARKTGMMSKIKIEGETDDF